MCVCVFMGFSFGAKEEEWGMIMELEHLFILQDESYLRNKQ